MAQNTYCSRVGPYLIAFVSRQNTWSIADDSSSTLVQEQGRETRSEHVYNVTSLTVRVRKLPVMQSLRNYLRNYA